MAVEKDVNINLKRAINFIEKAAKSGADIVCLPELFRSLYFCQKEDPAFFNLAEKIPGPTTQALSKIARKHKIVIVVPIFEKRAAGIYHNSAVILDADGKLAGLYRKMHIPDDPQYYEKFYFTPGDLGFRAFDSWICALWFCCGFRPSALLDFRLPHFCLMCPLPLAQPARSKKKPANHRPQVFH